MVKKIVVTALEIKPGQYYQGNLITAVDKIGEDYIWIEWEGDGYPKGSIFSISAKFLVTIYDDKDIIDV